METGILSARIHKGIVGTTVPVPASRNGKFLPLSAGQLCSTQVLAKNCPRYYPQNRPADLGLLLSSGIFIAEALPFINEEPVKAEGLDFFGRGPEHKVLVVPELTPEFGVVFNQSELELIADIGQ